MVQAISTNTFCEAKWVVSSDATQGTHTTIAGALTSASSGDTIFIRPGTYTENLTLKAGVNLVAWVGDGHSSSAIIVGKCSASYSGTASISGLRLKTNGDYAVEMTGSSATILNILDCFIDMNNASGFNNTVSNTSARLNIFRCEGDTGTTGIKFLNHSSTGQTIIRYSILLNTPRSLTASTLSAGSLNISYSGIFNTINVSGGSMDCLWSTLNSRGDQEVANISGGHATFTFCNVQSDASEPWVCSSGTIYLNMNTITTNGVQSISTGAGTTVYSYNAPFFNTALGSYATTTLTSFDPHASGFYVDTVKIVSGSGSPNGSLSLAKGSFYMRTDGSSSTTRLYTNTNGGTSWTPVTTSS